jgi:hypothetical protein
MNLEGVGSGSGLLDLTRESDDTSLGAVLDEIGPGASQTRQAVVSPMDSGLAAVAAAGEPVVSRTPIQPILTERPDPLAPAFGGAALAGFGVLLFGIYVLISAVMGTHPAATEYFAKNGLMMALGFGFAAVVVLFILGLVIGRAARR